MIETYGGKLIDSEDAAALLGCTEAALALWRKERRGPPYIRVERLVKYREVDLIAWIESRRVQPKPVASEGAA